MPASESTTESTPPVIEEALRTLKRRATTPGTDSHTAFPKLERMLLQRAEIGCQQHTDLLAAHNGPTPLVQAWQGAADLVLSLQSADLEGKSVYWPLQQAATLLFSLTHEIQETPRT